MSQWLEKIKKNTNQELATSSAVTKAKFVNLHILGIYPDETVPARKAAQFIGSNCTAEEVTFLFDNGLLEVLDPQIIASLNPEYLAECVETTRERINLLYEAVMAGTASDSMVLKYRQYEARVKQCRLLQGPQILAYIHGGTSPEDERVRHDFLYHYVGNPIVEAVYQGPYRGLADASTLTVEQIQAMSAEQLSGYDLRGLSKIQIQAIDPAALAGLDAKLFSTTGGWRTQQLEALAEKMHTVHAALLSADQLEELSERRLSGPGNALASRVATYNNVKRMTTDQLNLEVVEIASADKVLFQAISPEAVAGIPPEDPRIEVLMERTELLLPAQKHALQAVGLLNVIPNMEPEELKRISIDVIPYIDPRSEAFITLATNMDHLSLDQVSAFTKVQAAVVVEGQRLGDLRDSIITRQLDMVADVSYQSMPTVRMPTQYSAAQLVSLDSRAFGKISYEELDEIFKDPQKRAVVLQRSSEINEGTVRVLLDGGLLADLHVDEFNAEIINSLSDNFIKALSSQMVINISTSGSSEAQEALLGRISELNPQAMAAYMDHLGVDGCDEQVLTQFNGVAISHMSDELFHQLMAQGGSAAEVLVEKINQHFLEEGVDGEASQRLTLLIRSLGAEHCSESVLEKMSTAIVARLSPATIGALVERSQNSPFFYKDHSYQLLLERMDDEMPAGLRNTLLMGLTVDDLNVTLVNDVLMDSEVEGLLMLRPDFVRDAIRAEGDVAFAMMKRVDELASPERQSFISHYMDKDICTGTILGEMPITMLIDLPEPTISGLFEHGGQRLSTYLTKLNAQFSRLTPDQQAQLGAKLQVLSESQQDVLRGGAPQVFDMYFGAEFDKLARAEAAAAQYAQEVDGIGVSDAQEAEGVQDADDGSVRMSEATPVAAVTPVQAKLVDYHDAEPDALTPLVLQSMDEFEIQQIRRSTFEALSPEQIQAIPPELIPFLTNKQVTGSGGLQGVVGVFSGLTSPQIRAFTPEQLQALTDQQLQWFSPEQMQSFSSEQLTQMTDDQLQHMRKAQFQAIKPETLRMMGDRVSVFTVRQLKQFGVEQIAAFGSDQLAAIGPDKLRYLMSEQVEAIPEARKQGSAEARRAIEQAQQLVSSSGSSFQAADLLQMQTLVKQLYDYVHDSYYQDVREDRAADRAAISARYARQSSRKNSHEPLSTEKVQMSLAAEDAHAASVERKLSGGRIMQRAESTTDPCDVLRAQGLMQLRNGRHVQSTADRAVAQLATMSPSETSDFFNLLGAQMRTGDRQMKQEAKATWDVTKDALVRYLKANPTIQHFVDEVKSHSYYGKRGWLTKQMHNVGVKTDTKRYSELKSFLNKQSKQQQPDKREDEGEGESTRPGQPGQ